MSKNENIIAKLNELDRAVIEVKCAESDCRYMQIQECSSELGYDYTFYTEDGEDIDSFCSCKHYEQRPAEYYEKSA